MALTILEAKSLIEDGQAAPHLDRFIRAALGASFGALIGRQVAPPESDDALVAALALEKLMLVKEARRAVKLPPRRKGKTFDAHRYKLNHPVFAIGVRYMQKDLSEADAIDALGQYFDTAQVSVNEKTLKTFLGDLRDRAAELRTMLEYFIGLSKDLQSEDPDADDLVVLNHVFKTVMGIEFTCSRKENTALLAVLNPGCME